jgi:hypothetical protein
VRPYAFPRIRLLLRIPILVVALSLVYPLAAAAGSPDRHPAAANTHVTIVFGQEMGNIRPFSVTIAPNGTVTSNGPIRLTGNAAAVSRDAVTGLVVLAKAEGFRTLPSFTACPGALPDLATRYINIKTHAWHHRASARGSCLDSLNQLFAVLMSATHASF